MVKYIIIQTKDAAQLSTIATIIDNSGRTMQRVKLNTANQWVNISKWRRVCTM